MPTAADLLPGAWFGRRTNVGIGLVGLVALGLGLWWTVRFATERPAGPRAGPLMFSISAGRGVHIGDVVALVSAVGTAVGAVGLAAAVRLRLA